MVLCAARLSCVQLGRRRCGGPARQRVRPDDRLSVVPCGFGRAPLAGRAPRRWKLEFPLASGVCLYARLWLESAGLRLAVGTGCFASGRGSGPHSAVRALRRHGGVTPNYYTPTPKGEGATPHSVVIWFTEWSSTSNSRDGYAWSWNVGVGEKDLMAT